MPMMIMSVQAQDYLRQLLFTYKKFLLFDRDTIGVATPRITGTQLVLGRTDSQICEILTVRL